MNRLFLSGISIFAVMTTANSQAMSFGGGGFGGSSSSRFGMELNYDYLQQMDIGILDASQPTAREYVNGNIQAQRGLISLTYSPSSSIKFAVIGGMAISNRVTMTSTVTSGTDITQDYDFSNAPSYGMSLQFEIIPDSRIHLRPSMRWLQTSLRGTKSTVRGANGCTYDFSSGTAATSNCLTLGGVVISGYVHSLDNQFTQNDFTAGMELAFDFGGETNNPGFSAFVGASESLTSIAGTSRMTITGAPVNPYGTEMHSFQSSTREGLYAGISAALAGSMRIGAIYRAIDQHSVTGTFSIGF